MSSNFSHFWSIRYTIKHRHTWLSNDSPLLVYVVYLEIFQGTLYIIWMYIWWPRGLKCQTGHKVSNYVYYYPTLGRSKSYSFQFGSQQSLFLKAFQYPLPLQNRFLQYTNQNYFDFYFSIPFNSTLTTLPLQINQLSWIQVNKTLNMTTLQFSFV